MFKRIKIMPYELGLVFHGSAPMDILKEGVHWVSNKYKVTICNTSISTNLSFNIDLLQKNEKVASYIDFIEVKEDELYFQFKNGLFYRYFNAGKYAFWKGAVDYTYQIVNIEKHEVSQEFVSLMTRRAELRPLFHCYIIESFEKALLLTDGKVVKQLVSGIYYYWNNSHQNAILKVDTRMQQMEISGQELLTKDKASLRLNFFTEYIVIDIEKALMQTKDYTKQFYILMQLALREFVGQYTLDELLANKTLVSTFVVETCQTRASEMGIKIGNCGLRDIILPGDMKEIMNQVLMAEKKAQANTIMRREETAFTRSLLNTAKLMEDNEMLFKLKEMEYVEKISEKIHSISLSGGTQVMDQLKGLFSVPNH